MLLELLILLPSKQTLPGVSPTPVVSTKVVDAFIGKTTNTDKPKGYQGFLYVQCEECKEFKGFMPKKPLTTYKCNCGHVTELKDMIVARFDCECGKNFKYLTNTRDINLSINCLSCGQPVDLEYHVKNDEYVRMT